MDRKRVTLWGVLAALGLTMVLLLMSSSPTSTARAAEFTVCTAGPPDCGYSSVQDAVFAARDGDLIKIAGGVYTGVWNWLGTNTTYLTATQMVVITQSLTLRGGYTVTNWTTPNPEANPTTLDAQDQGRVMIISGPISVTLDGLSLMHGNSEGLGGKRNTYPSISYIGNVGGGVYAVTATVTLSTCNLIQNRTPISYVHPFHDYGGGMYANGAVTVVNSQIRENEGECTGGLYLDDVDRALLQGNSFESNVGGGHCYNGGGLWAAGRNILVQDNLFRDNYAYGGGGLSLRGDVTVTQNLITGNHATYGGGLCVYSTPITSGIPMLTRNQLIENSTHFRGGAVVVGCMGSTTAVLENNIIAGNQDTRTYCDTGSGGSAVFQLLGDSVLSHNTILDNPSPNCEGPAIYLSSGTMSLTNNTIVSHSLGITVSALATATLDGTLWGAGDWANGTDWAGDGTILTGTTNVWGDPGFIDPDAGDYHIGLASAARDAGVAVELSDDMDGDLRPQGAGYDIGADEFPFCDTVTEIPKAECEALVALYNITGGPNWTNNTGWLETNTPCSWFGVDCSAGHLWQLSLSDNQLRGNIPAELGDLANLQLLNLSYNDLSGNMTPDLGGLANLQYLNLSYNQLTGSIPPELGSLVNLGSLYLQVNQLSGAIPPELGDLVSLGSLHLGSNQLSGSIPSSLAKLVELGYLSFSSNQLSGGIPVELGELGNLRILLLADNQLTGGVPMELGSLASLEVLELQANQLDGSIPEVLANPSNPQNLRLDWNQLSGIIPAEARKRCGLI